MGKDITSLPEVWIVTGFSYDCDGTRILAVCPTEQDAQNAVNYYKKHYDDVEYECFSQETYDPVPVLYGGVFTAEVRPYGNDNDTYILGQVRITQSQQPIDEDVPNPKEFEYVSFTLITKTDNTGHKSCELCGNFLSAEEIPIKTSINVGKAAREWLIEKVNEKGVIKLVIPDFEE